MLLACARGVVRIIIVISGAALTFFRQNVYQFRSFAQVKKELLLYHAQASETTRARTNFSTLVRSNNTIITALFLVNSTKRHSDQEYIDLMARLFSNNDSMVIFTSPDLAPKLKQIRGGKPERTVVIPMELSETKVARIYAPEFWSRVSEDGNGTRKVHGIHSGLNYEIYQIWNSKVEFVKLASDMNPFQSNFFAWVDAGLIRWDQYTNSTILDRIPPELPDNKMALLDVTPILLRKNYHQMGGGFIGGYKPAVDLYYTKYYEKIQEYANSTTRYNLLSNEQIILHDTCTENPGLCFVIWAKRAKHNPLTPCLTHPYFYMLPFLNEREYNIMEKQGLVDKKGWYNHTVLFKI